MAEITIKLIDTDVLTGAFRYEIHGEENVADDGNTITGANVAGAFLRDFMASREFSERVWRFAEATIEAKKDIDPASLKIINQQQRPQTLAA